MLVEHVLGNPKVRERISKYCVGLAACCDPPDVEQPLLLWMSERFPDARSMFEALVPFAPGLATTKPIASKPRQPARISDPAAIPIPEPPPSSGASDTSGLPKLLIGMLVLLAVIVLALVGVGLYFATSAS